MFTNLLRTRPWEPVMYIFNTNTALKYFLNVLLKSIQKIYYVLDHVGICIVI